MAEPRSGWTTFLIMVSPLPGKYELDETETGGPFLDTALQFMVHRWFSVFDINRGKKCLLLRKQTQPCNHLKAGNPRILIMTQFDFRGRPPLAAGSRKSPGSKMADVQSAFRGPPVHGPFRSYRSDGVSVWLETALQLICLHCCSPGGMKVTPTEVQITLAVLRYKALIRLDLTTLPTMLGCSQLSHSHIKKQITWQLKRWETCGRFLWGDREPGNIWDTSKKIYIKLHRDWNDNRLRYLK